MGYINIRSLLIFVCLVVIGEPAFLSAAQNPNHPKIALVLSGGGARGMAHVGVLKVLEELRIPISYITGTSMGAAVGGIYASGLSAQDMESIFKDFDWPGAFRDGPDRRHYSFRRKEDDRTFLVRKKVGIGKKGIELPRGFVEGQQFVTELRKIAHITRPIDSFDNLPIPFRAMATDLEKGESVTLDHGDLVLAIRASVALSPLFSPIEYQGRLLVDGGYLRNIPVETAQEFNPDIIIAVSLGTPSTDREKINSVLAVFSETSRLGTLINNRDQLSKLSDDDILIEPNLDGLTILDFDRVNDFIHLGERAAREKKSKLSQYSLSENDYAAWRHSLKSVLDFPVIHEIQINNHTRFPDQLIRAHIRQNEGTVLDPQQIQEDLTQIYGLGYFEWLDYHVEEKNGRNILAIECPPKSWGPNYLRFGFKVDESFTGDSSYGILTRYQKTGVNRYGAEVQVDGEVGTNSAIQAEYYQPMGGIPDRIYGGRPYFSFVNAGYAYQNDPLLFRDHILIPFEVRRAHASVGLGRTLGDWAQLKIGIGYHDEIYESPTLPVISIDHTLGDGFVKLEIDTLDQAGFPQKGWIGLAEVRKATKALGSDENASAFRGRLGTAASVGKNTIRLNGFYNTNLDGRHRDYLFRLGGFSNLSGFAPNSLFGSESALGQIYLIREVVHVMGMPLYLGSMGEWGNIWLRQDDITLDSGIWSGSAFAALDTVLGPVYLSYTLLESRGDGVSLTIGQSF